MYRRGPPSNAITNPKTKLRMDKYFSFSDFRAPEREGAGETAGL